MAHIFAPKPSHRSKMLNSLGFAPTQSHFKMCSNVRNSSSCFGFHHHCHFPKKMCRKIGHIFSKFYSIVSLHLSSTWRLKSLCGLNGQGFALIRPFERFSCPIVIVDEGQNLRLQVLYAGEGAALEQLAHQNRKP